MQSFVSRINWVDIIIVGMILFYAIEGYLAGAIHALFDFIKFIISFIIGLKTYALLGMLLVKWFAMPQGLAKAAGFFIAIIFIETLLHFLFRSTFSRISNSLTGAARQIDRGIGFVLGGMSGVLFTMVLLSIFVAIPASPFLKNEVGKSATASLLLSQTQLLEKNLHGVFDGATQDTLNFLTVKPDSNSTLKLNFSANGTVDIESENQMLIMVNQERERRGLPPLMQDAALQKVARAHADDMLRRGYFSHYTPEGLSPFDRMNAAGIVYEYAGENLALSPDVQLAMTGLMNSPGHRENILYPHFKKAGIGVLDGGFYGKMFVQEFTD